MNEKKAKYCVLYKVLHTIAPLWKIYEYTVDSRYLELAYLE